MTQMKITYTDKTNSKDIVDRTKQATAEDFNEIKEVVNANADSKYESTQVLVLESLGATYDCSISVNAQLTLTSECFLPFTNLIEGMSGNLKVIQDSVGSHGLAIDPIPSVIDNGGGLIALTGTAESVDILSWWYDGVDLNITIGPNYTKEGAV